MGGEAGSDGRKVLGSAAIVALWVAVWQVASMLVGNGLLLAGPAETLGVLCSLVGRGAFWSAVSFSFARIAAGFLVAFLLALALAALVHAHPLVRAALRPPLMAFKSAPVVCLVVLLLIWFGSRNVAAASVFLVAFPAVYFSALESLDRLDPRLDEALRVNGVGRGRRVLAFVWPAMLPFLRATSETMVGMSWKAGVAAELIGIPLGSIGERIYQSKLLLDTASLFAWTLVVVLLSFACERAFVTLLGASADVAVRLAVPPRAAVGHGTPSGPAVLGLEDVRVSFAGRDVMSEVSHDFPAGSRTCLVDPSGAGKTTTLRLLAGLLAPTSGAVLRTANVSMAFQESRLVEALDARDNVALVARGSRSWSETDALLRELLPKEALDRPVSELSGGMRRRVDLAVALSAPSHAVLLDEPFSSLDEASHEAAVACVLGHLDGRTLVVATHDPRDAAALGAEAIRICP